VLPALFHRPPTAWLDDFSFDALPPPDFSELRRSSSRLTYVVFVVRERKKESKIGAKQSLRYLSPRCMRECTDSVIINGLLKREYETELSSWRKERSPERAGFAWQRRNKLGGDGDIVNPSRSDLGGYCGVGRWKVGAVARARDEGDVAPYRQSTVAQVLTAVSASATNARRTHADIRELLQTADWLREGVHNYSADALRCCLLFTARPLKQLAATGCAHV